MIKADGTAKVKHRCLWLALAALCIAAPRVSHADVSEKDVQGLEQQEFGIESKKSEKKAAEKPANPETRPEDYQQQADTEKVKPIEAEEFRVKLTKKSHSGKVLLFEDLNDNRPKPGRIILLKKDNDDIAAVRILKNLQGKFIGKVVLPVNELKPNTEYRAIKKLGEKIVAQIREREKRGKDLEANKTDEDLAKEVNPDDNELDRGIPTPKKKTKKVIDKPGGASGPADLDTETSPAKPDPNKPEALFTKEGQELPDPESIEVKDEDEAANDVTVNEDLPIEAHLWALSIEYGSVHSVDAGGNPATDSAIGARLAFNVFKMGILHRKSLQDMLSLELGLFYYTIASFQTTGDSVTVYPIIGTVRYSLLFGESFSIYPYLGFMKNSVSGSPATAGGTTSTAVLDTTKAAVGIGTMFKLGPQWAVRIDFGTDLFGVGAVLKF